VTVLGMALYQDLRIPWSPVGPDLTVRFSHPRFAVGGRVEPEVMNVAELSIAFKPCRWIAEWVVVGNFLTGLSSSAQSLESAAVQIEEFLWVGLEPLQLTVTLESRQHSGGTWTVELTR
jgi:hypothetical protein